MRMADWCVDGWEGNGMMKGEGRSGRIVCIVTKRLWSPLTLPSTPHTSHSPYPTPALLPCLNCTQMDMMLPDVDADISAYPVGNGVVIEVAERPTSPSSRLVDHVSAAAAVNMWGQAPARACCQASMPLPFSCMRAADLTFAVHLPATLAHP